MPGDPSFPTEKDWNDLNKTVGGRLISGVPLAKICYGATDNQAACSKLQQQWPTVDPYLNDPVNVMSPYWQNNSCSPFKGPKGTCTLGNNAIYAINVSDASTAIAGIKFAQEKNVRLSIKNTGHDLLGRSSGAGSLALWTHNLKNVSFMTYKSSGYTGPAAKVGAGLQVRELYEIAKEHKFRVVGGGCPTVGLAGWLPGGGHGPLSSAYGLGADQVLEFEVVTIDGQHVTASASQNEDLFWALSGGGAGNYAVLLSMTIRAHPDGPVAGTRFLFNNTNSEKYWAAITAWLKHLLVLDANFPSMNTAVTFTNRYFYLDFATFPDKTKAEMLTAFQPFYQELEKIGVKLETNETAVSPTFFEHYDHFEQTAPWIVNQTVGDRFIPRSLIRDKLPDFIATLRGIMDPNDAAVFVFVANNVTHARVGNTPQSNAVNPAWRDALLLLNFGMELSPDASWATMSSRQAEVNGWINKLRTLTPGGGGYLNEGTFDDSQWKSDYYGSNYDKLASIKSKYDPESLLWVNTAVGSDHVWMEEADMRLCRVVA
ncbi:FAD-binding domain-containing protein [Annulohypoxylon nitens]|nr:FAD-binding domain-containing protein [Annulohypoxylon nitens]